MLKNTHTTAMKHNAAKLHDRRYACIKRERKFPSGKGRRPVLPKMLEKENEFERRSPQATRTLSFPRDADEKPRQRDTSTPVGAHTHPSHFRIAVA